MVDGERELESLIKDLQRSTSRLEQLKILTRAWRVLRTLSPRQRVEVAAHLGLEEAQPLLESLGSPGGLSPATLARAVAKAERAHRAELDGILQNLRTPGRRLEAIREGIDLVETSFEEEGKDHAPPRAVKPPTSGPPPPGPSERSLPPPPKTPSAAEPTPPEPAKALPAEPPGRERREAREAAAQEPSKTPSPQAAEALVEDEKVQRPDEAPTPRPQRPAAVGGAPKPETPTAKVDVQAGLDSRWAAVTQPAPPIAAVAPPKPAVSAKRLTARFRELRRLVEAGDIAADQVGSLLASFPEGWPRRRALTALIGAGAVDDVEALLGEITRMERPMDEYWCLSALVRAHLLSPLQIESALTRVRAPSSRRLLKRLLAS